jgi:hypothetical protein
LDGYARIIAEASMTGRRLTRAELESRRVLGAQAAESGHGWRALVRDHLAASRIDRPASTDLDSVLSAVEQAIDAFAEGYEHAQRLVARREEAARREFIDDLLHGRGDAGHLAASRGKLVRQSSDSLARSLSSGS